MKRFFGEGRKIVLISLAALVVFLVMLFGFTSTGLVEIPFLSNVISTVFVPIQEAVSGGIHAIGQSISQRRTQMELTQQLDELTQQNKVLQAQIDQMSEISVENERLRALLSVKETMPEYEYIGARVTGKEPGGWFQSFTLNVGENDGVKQNDVVINNDGLIGRITQVNASSSVVMSLIDSRSAVSALIERTRDSGVVHGSLNVTDSDELLQMYYLPDGTELNAGDRVITSGLDSIYPKGQYIGRVRAIGRDDRYAVVETAVDFAHLEDVLVIKMDRPDVPAEQEGS